MKNKLFNIVSTVLLVIFVIALVLKSRSVKNEFVTMELEIQKCRGENALLKNNIIANCKLPIIPIKLQTINLTDIKGKRISLDSVLASGSKRIVLRLSEEQCSSCMDKEVRNIERIQSEIEPDQIIILATFPSSFAHRMFIRENRLRCEVYNIEATSRVSYNDSILSPYYFVVDSSLRASWFYRPIIGLEELTDNYLTEISSIINTKN